MTAFHSSFCSQPLTFLTVKHNLVGQSFNFQSTLGQALMAKTARQAP